MEESDLSISARHSRYQISPSDFDLVALAGRGAFGKVWVVRKKNDFSGKVMAMKEMNKKDMVDRGYVEHTKQEKEIMAKVGGFPFVVDLYFTFHSDLHLYIVMEYVPGGNLLSYVMDTADPWPEDTCQFYGGEILLGLEYIHNQNIIYKDLKLENVLLDMDGHVRLTDFGLSKQLDNSSGRVSSMSGTAAYLAPEVIDNREEGHGQSVDIWAFGVTMFTILLHESPFYSENLTELFEMILHDEVEWEYYKEDLSPAAFSLLQGLLTKDPTKRLGCGERKIQEIKEHPFFASINWDDLLAMKVKPLIRPKLRVAERATKLDRDNLMSGRASTSTDKGEFADFSFIAADFVQPSAATITESEGLSSWSLSEEEGLGEFAWPFTCGSLPFAAVNQIVEYLSIIDIIQASGVCKTWHKFLWTNIREIDFSPVRPNLFAQYWHSHICHIVSQPQRLLKMRMNHCITDDLVIYIPPITPLEVLNFRECLNISKIAIKNLSISSTSSAGNKALRPKRLKFPMLVELNLSFCVNIDDAALEQVAKTLPLLKRLDLAFCTNITDAGLAFLHRLHSLWRLDLQGLQNLTDQGIIQLVDLPNLRVLELSGCQNLTSKGVEALRMKATQLEVLIWSDCAPHHGLLDNNKSVKNSGLAGRIKSSLFKVSRDDKGSKTPSKNFLPSFKKKRAAHMKHKKGKSVDQSALGASFPFDEEAPILSIPTLEVLRENSISKDKKNSKRKTKDKKRSQDPLGPGTPKKKKDTKSKFQEGDIPENAKKKGAAVAPISLPPLVSPLSPEKKKKKRREGKRDRKMTPRNREDKNKPSDPKSPPPEKAAVESRPNSMEEDPTSVSSGRRKSKPVVPEQDDIPGVTQSAPTSPLKGEIAENAKKKGEAVAAPVSLPTKSSFEEPEQTSVPIPDVEEEPPIAIDISEDEPSKSEESSPAEHSVATPIPTALPDEDTKEEVDSKIEDKEEAVVAESKIESKEELVESKIENKEESKEENKANAVVKSAPPGSNLEQEVFASIREKRAAFERLQKVEQKEKQPRFRASTDSPMPRTFSGDLKKPEVKSEPKPEVEPEKEPEMEEREEVKEECPEDASVLAKKAAFESGPTKMIKKSNTVNEGKRNSVVLQRKAAFESAASPREPVPEPATPVPEPKPEPKPEPEPELPVTSESLLAALGKNPAKKEKESEEVKALRSVHAIASMFGP